MARCLRLVTVALGLTGCAHTDTAGNPCRSDADCKLDRICETARCVWPAEARVPRAKVLPGTGDPGNVPTAVRSGTGAATGAVRSRSGTAPLAPALGMFRFDPAHRGRTPFRLPAKRPEVRWAYETRGPVTSSPALLPDGLIAVGSHDGRLHAVTPQGRMRWVFPTGDLVFGSPAVAANGVVYVGSDDDHLYALDPKAGQELWRFRAGNCRPSGSIGVGPENSRCDADSGPTVGPDGTIYLGGEGIFALNPDGSLKWQFATGGHVGSAPALLPDGTVIAGCQDNNVYAIAPDGSKRWEFRAGDDVESSPAIAEDGTIYVGADDQKLYALSPAGGLKWAFNAGDDIRASPAIGTDGSIYVGAFDGLFYAVRPDGTLQWTFRAGDRILSSALVDAGGAILFGAQDDRLYALEPNGHMRWSVELGGDVDSSPVLGPDGTIYVGSDDRRLYALR